MYVEIYLAGGFIAVILTVVGIALLISDGKLDAPDIISSLEFLFLVFLLSWISTVFFMTLMVKDYFDSKKKEK
jgi:hypothetical protein